MPDRVFFAGKWVDEPTDRERRLEEGLAAARLRRPARELFCHPPDGLSAPPPGAGRSGGGDEPPG
jgi:hypothetical protein